MGKLQLLTQYLNEIEMTFYDNMIQRFETELGTLGYGKDGYLTAGKYPNIDRGFCPVWDGVLAIQDPARFAALYVRAVAGDTSVIGENDGMNDAGLEITATGVYAEINIGMDTYEQELTFEEFAPILAVWQKAWAAAQAYKASLS
jgi:hypothetical protein